MDIKKTFYFIIAAIVLANLCSCWLVPIKYHDKKLTPYLQAIAKVKHLRDSLGFTHISEKAKITLEGSSDNYDAMLHIYQSASSRTIAFKKDGDHYTWIGEQEIFTGPQKYETVDGTLNEELVLNYDKQPISGYPTNMLNINYNGPDSSYTSPRELSIPDAQAIIKKWQH
jgi:hypothetical protein